MREKEYSSKFILHFKLCSFSILSINSIPPFLLYLLAKFILFAYLSYMSNLNHSRQQHGDG